MTLGLERLSRDVSLDIEEYIRYSGVLYRIFNRAKSFASIKRKNSVKKYLENNKLMQDIIGIRITLYFNDDIDIIYNILRSHPDFIDESKDEIDIESFKPQRLNLIFKLKDYFSEELKMKLDSKLNFIDNTFEIQIRTVLSEGWHEVEHDLRYKNKKDWENQDDVSRVLNGIYATLETQDWSILSVFEKLAYRHYKLRNWSAMLRNKFRIRLNDNQDLDIGIISVFNNDLNLAKEFFKLDRKDFINKIIERKLIIPLTLNNIVFVSNLLFFNNNKLINLTPNSLIEKMKS